jgi:hypothetical protein
MRKSKLIGKWFVEYNYQNKKVEYVSLLEAEVAQNLFMIVQFSPCGEPAVITKTTPFFNDVRWFPNPLDIYNTLSEYETSSFPEDRWFELGILADELIEDPSPVDKNAPVAEKSSTELGCSGSI